MTEFFACAILGLCMGWFIVEYTFHRSDVRADKKNDHEDGEEQ